ncbi:MAG: PAS domain S-box protein [Cytophagales bacterium]
MKRITSKFSIVIFYFFLAFIWLLIKYLTSVGSNYNQSFVPFLADLIFAGISAVLVFMYASRGNKAAAKLEAVKFEIDQVDKRFRQLADSSPAMLWTSDEKGKIIYYNNSWLDFRGISLNDEMEWGWKDGIHPDDYEHLIYDIYNPSIENKKGFTAEYRLKNKTGEFKWILENAVPKFDSNGQFEGLFGSAIDITEIKLTQLNLKKQEKFNSRISELSPDNIYIYDLGLKENIYTNKSLTELMGYAKDEFILYNESVFLKLIHEEDYKNVQYNPAYFSRLTANIFVDQEFRMKAPNGSWRWIHTRETIFSQDENGIPTQILGTARDITDKKQVEQEIVRTNEELKTINEELDGFVYRASHDLRAPLSSVLGLINLAKLDVKDDTALFYFDMMQKSIQKLSDVTQDLIDHAQNAGMGVTLVPINFNTIVRDIMDGMRFHDNAAKIRFDLQINSGIEFVADRLRLVLLFNNLLSNAIKYHDVSKEAPFIKVNIVISEKNAQIEVSDNGLGIEEEFQGKIFDMFFRANKSVSGTGLGLYIVKGAVDKMKGTIKLQSKPKQGTTFYVEIPNRA